MRLPRRCLPCSTGRPNGSSTCTDPRRDLGPKLIYVDSTLDVLREVRDAVATTQPGRAPAFDAAITQPEIADAG